MKRITACIVVLLTAMFLPLAVSAQETTLTTVVPSGHTLHIELMGEGRIVVDGVAYTQTADIQIQRHSQPVVSVKSNNNFSVTFNGEDITEQIRNGNWRMPPMNRDTQLIVVFEGTATIPITGDRINASLLFVVAYLSLMGLLLCLRAQRRIK